MSWREFWNRENSIYVNDRHKALHDELVADGIVALVAAPTSSVLDYGCGDASSAERVASACARLSLYDAAPNVRARLRQRFAGKANIEVIEDESLAAVAPGSLDLIVVNSVLQYVSKPDFEALLDRFRPKLKAGGSLVLADIISPDASALGDVLALLGFALRGGFLIAACAGLVATVCSDYPRLRAQLGLTRYTEDEMTSLLAAHGYTATRLRPNIGHNQTRMMFEARPAAQS